MLDIATKILDYVGPLIVAIERRKLEGKSQKEIAMAINRDEVWVSRRVQKALEHGLLEVRKEDRWGWHYTYRTFAKWEVNTVWLTSKGQEVAKTILNLDPIIEWCPSCGGGIDITGYSGVVACPYCGYKLYVEGIEPPRTLNNVPWWVYPIAALGGGSFGAVLDNENRWRGFGIGAAILSIIIALIDGCLRLLSIGSLV